MVCIVWQEQAAGTRAAPVGPADGAHGVDGEGVLLGGLVAEPVQHARDLLRGGALQLPPPLPPHQVVHQRLLRRTQTLS